MAKKVIAALLALTLTFSVCAFAQNYTDVSYGSESGTAIDVLSALGVLSGSGDGYFHPDDFLTRAQFAKIAVCAMGMADKAVDKTSAFSDVSATDWYAGYVNAVAGTGIIEGYPDGSFGANQNITYAQAITVLVRLLGYTSEDVGYKWPQGYLEKAEVLGITENISYDYNAPITRGGAALLVYRTLFTDTKDGGELVTKMDANVYEDAVITATRAENSALLENEVQTSAGVFKRGGAAVAAGFEGTLVVNDNSEIIAFVENDNQTKEDYVISRVYKETNSSDISVITDDGRTLSLDEETALYQNGQKTTVGALTDVTEGSALTVFYENNLLKYVLLNEYKMQGPKTAYSKNVASMFTISDINSLKVIRKGITASLSDIEIYDVCYYSEKTNTLYAYNDRVTGVYEEAYPIKANVSSVKVSGNTYNLSTTQAISRLGESENAFKIGDRVTLLLGTDGSVVDAVSLTDADITLYGVLTGTSLEISENADTKGRAQRYVTLLMADGSEAKYLTDTDYDEKAGKFCELDFENSYARLTFPSEKTISGVVDKDAKTLGGVSFASDYSILEYEDGDETKADVKKITIADLDGVKLTSNDVIHIKTNAKGEIVVLYVKNASGSRDTYGIVTGAPSETSNGYTLLSGTQKISVPAGSWYISAGDGARYYDGVLTALIKIAEGVRIESCVDNLLTINSHTYTLSDSVMIFSGSNAGDLKAISIEDALSLSGSVTLYSERSEAEGCKIRVIKIYT